MKKLNQLLPIDSDLAIESIHSDSRKIRPNSIFFCLDGLSVNGHQFIEEAIYKGAVCIVHSKDVLVKNKDIVYYQVKDTLKCLNEVACKFYDDPSQQLNMIGVTGTNGKTIVSMLIYQIAKKVMPFGYIGTHHVLFNKETCECEFTTPEIIFLQEHLRKMVNAGIQGACLEVSSHGLALGRVAGVDFDMAIFTNLSPEHLDFHGSMDNYVKAKLKLFEGLRSDAIAIVNRDDEEMFNRISTLTKAHVLSFGIEHVADIQATKIVLRLRETLFEVLYEGYTYPVKTSLIGQFNIYHILAAILALLQIGFTIEQAIEAIEGVNNIEGRLEYVETGHKFHAFVDNGHSPQHYEQVLSYASKVVGEGRIIAVFGSVGKREFKKRQVLGEIADHYCDHIILTEEDPRDEDTEEICEQIKKGIKKTKNVVITDRETAIYQAVEIANPNDIILILGKGEEQTMYKRRGPIPYIGDKQALLNAIEEVYGGEEDYEL